MQEFRQMAQDLEIKDGSIFQRNFSTYLAMTKYPFPDAFYGSSFAQLHPFLTADVGIPFSDGLLG
jgi:hypothetical protein